jgi:hypothetical protein
LLLDLFHGKDMVDEGEESYLLRCINQFPSDFFLSVLEI